MSKKAVALDPDTETVSLLDPNTILAEDNSRWGIKDTTVDNLMRSILEHGGVMEPGEATELPEDAPQRTDGFTHRLTFGFNRLEAVKRLNKEQNAGILMPVFVRELEDTPAARIRRQIAENVDREGFSPMDKAIAIKRLLDTGMIKADIRRVFSSAGGRKGNQVQPMSSAMLNILLNLLVLPKSVQEKIHVGIIGVEGAYQLGKVPADKRAAVIEVAERERLKQIEIEEKDEDRLLKSEQRLTEAEQKVVSSESEIEQARTDLASAAEVVNAKVADMKAVKVSLAQQDTPITKQDVERQQAAEADVKAAKKLHKDATNKLAKLHEAKTAAQTTVEKVREQLDAKRNAKKVKKPIGKTAVQAAAKEVGTTAAGYVPLKIADIRQMVKDVAAGKSGADDRVARVALCFKQCFDGKDTEKETVTNLTNLLDAMGAVLPKKEPKATPPEAPDVQQGPKTKAKK